MLYRFGFRAASILLVLASIFLFVYSGHAEELSGHVYHTYPYDIRVLGAYSDLSQPATTKFVRDFDIIVKIGVKYKSSGQTLTSDKFVDSFITASEGSDIKKVDHNNLIDSNILSIIDVTGVGDVTINDRGLGGHPSETSDGFTIFHIGIRHTQGSHEGLLKFGFTDTYTIIQRTTRVVSSGDLQSHTPAYQPGSYEVYVHHIINLNNLGSTELEVGNKKKGHVLIGWGMRPNVAYRNGDSIPVGCYWSNTNNAIGMGSDDFTINPNLAIKNFESWAGSLYFFQFEITAPSAGKGIITVSLNRDAVIGGNDPDSVRIYYGDWSE